MVSFKISLNLFITINAATIKTTKINDIILTINKPLFTFRFISIFCSKKKIISKAISFKLPFFLPASTKSVIYLGNTFVSCIASSKS